MATYKKPTKKDPLGDPVHLEIADIYLKMGLREDALAQYRILLQHYKSLGRKDKALKVMALMARMDPRKTDLEKKITGLEHLLKLKDKEAGIDGPEEPAIPKESFGPKKKEAYFDLGAELKKVDPDSLIDYKEIELLEKAYGFGEIFKRLRDLGGPGSLDFNFNYNMGMACREVGFTDDAIEQFQIAYKERQNPFEAAHLLGLCFKEKRMWEEARQAFEKALKVDGISQGNIRTVKCELGLIFKEQGKTEEALELLRKISAVDQGVRNTKEKVSKLTKKSPRK